MRAFRISVVLALLFATTAHAQGIPPDVRRPMLLAGAKGVGYTLAITGVSAGLGALIASARCASENGGDFCDAEHPLWQTAAAGALVGGVFAYAIGIGVGVPWGYDEEGRKHGLRGRRGFVAFAAVASTVTVLAFTFVAMATYQDEGPRVVAPVATFGVLSAMVAPWGLGYVAYRGSHRRAIERMMSPTSFGVRF